MLREESRFDQSRGFASGMESGASLGELGQGNTLGPAGAGGVAAAATGRGRQQLGLDESSDDSMEDIEIEDF